jgi:hypothetical protein
MGSNSVVPHVEMWGACLCFEQGPCSWHGWTAIVSCYLIGEWDGKPASRLCLTAECAGSFRPGMCPPVSGMCATQSGGALVGLQPDGVRSKPPDFFKEMNAFPGDVCCARSRLFF